MFQADILPHSTPSPGSRGNEPLSRPRQADWAASIKRNMMRNRSWANKKIQSRCVFGGMVELAISVTVQQRQLSVLCWTAIAIPSLNIFGAHSAAPKKPVSETNWSAWSLTIASRNTLYRHAWTGMAHHSNHLSLPPWSLFRTSGLYSGLRIRLQGCHKEK